MKTTALVNFVRILQELMKMKLQNISNLEYLVKLTVRQMLVEDSSEKMRIFILRLINLFTDEMDYIMKNFINIGIFFAKFLMMLSFLIAAEMTDLKTMILKLTQNMWLNRKDGKFLQKN